MRIKKKDTFESIFEKVLKKNALSKDELKKLQKDVKSFLGELNSELKKRGIRAEAMLGGSAAKGTSLKNDFDCDVFVRFDLSYKGDNISILLGDALSKFKPKKIHGSRDYFELYRNNIHFEVVPVLKIKSYKDAENVTDASPLHVEWVLSELNKNPALKDDIILAKMFCKSADVYGAESFIKGFSGHVLDILIIYYKGFMNLIKNAVKWSEGDIIDIKKYYKDKDDLLKKINSSKTLSPLIVIDPIQPERNAAAGLSKECFEKFKSYANEFLKKPSEIFFIKKKFDIDLVIKKKRNNKLVVVKIEPLEGPVDVVGTKILKFYEQLLQQVEIYGFKIKKKGWYWNKICGKKGKGYVWIYGEKRNLPKNYEWKGPPLTEKTASENFKKKYRNWYVKDKRLYAKVERKFTELSEFIKEIVKKDFLRKKVRRIEIEVY